MAEDNDTGEWHEGARSFARFFEDLANGQAQLDASEALFELTTELAAEAVRTSRAVTGDLTIKLKIKVEPTGAAGLAYDIKTKAAPKKTPTGFMWVTAGGNLSPHNPRQQHLPLREVGGDDGDARDVGEAPDDGAREV